MADWNWGQIIFQAVVTGILVTVFQEIAKRIRKKKKGKGRGDE